MPSIPFPLEHEEQASFVTEVKYQYRNDETFLEALFFSVPNGMFAGGKGKKGRSITIAKQKAEGFNPGVADIQYQQPRGHYPYFCMEIKRRDRMGEKDGGLSKEQISYRNAALACGAFWCKAYGAEDAMQYFNSYMDLKPFLREK